jgi:hypothetical protein
MAPGTPTSVGKAALEERLKTLMDQFQIELKSEVRQVEASGDFAFVRADFEGRQGVFGASAGVARGHRENDRQPERPDQRCALHDPAGAALGALRGPQARPRTSRA